MIDAIFLYILYGAAITGLLFFVARRPLREYSQQIVQEDPENDPETIAMWACMFSILLWPTWLIAGLAYVIILIIRPHKLEKKS